jgi:hypothetical protein
MPPGVRTAGARNISIAIRARSGGGAPGSRPTPSAHRRRDRRGRLRARSDDRATLDRHEGRKARQDDRPAGGVSRHARDLGPFQRLPDLPRAAHAADPARLDRLPRRLPLQAALSRGRLPASPKAAWRSCAGHRLQARIWAIRAGRKTCCSTSRRRDGAAHRQGIFLGCAAVGARHDAHGDLQRACAAIPTASTRCSCTWPTWPGTRR